MPAPGRCGPRSASRTTTSRSRSRGSSPCCCSPAWRPCSSPIREARRSPRSSGPVLAAIWRRAAPGRSITTSSASRDARMARTKGRPLASGRIEPRRGLLFGTTLGVVAVAQLWITVNALTAALAAAGAARLRLRLHALAQAADAPEHRARRRGRRDAAAGRLGGRDGRPHPRRALALRDRLLLDTAALLGALAADLRRLRTHRSPDAPRGPGRDHHPPSDRPLRAAAGRDHDRAR